LQPYGSNPVILSKYLLTIQKISAILQVVLPSGPGWMMIRQMDDWISECINGWVLGYVIRPVESTLALIIGSFCHGCMSE
jgi:hypothetical protein